MNRRSSLSTRSLIAAALLSAAGIVVAHDAYAAPGDAAAQKLDKEAMDSDYLNVAFDKAKSKLDKAIKECGSDCSKETQVKLQVHLGIILANMGKPAEAKDAFLAALKLDGKAEPEKDFTSPDVQKAFEEAKKSAPAATEEPPKEEKKPKKPAGDDDDGEVKGDLRHEAITEHQSSVPLPIWASGEGVAKMVLHYKPFGGDWTKLEMKKMGKGFGAEIPCKDTSTSGTLQYYITAQDSAGDSAGANGSKRDPYKVSVKQKISGDLAHFPDKEPPAKCAAECPPGLPGCTTARLGYGSKCTGPNQCESGLACVEGTCSPGDENKTDEPAEGDEAKKNYFSFNLIGDVALVSGSDLCSKQNQIDGAYTCFKSNDKQYAGNPASGKGGALEGFAQFGTVRVTLGYDRRVAKNLLVGARLGYAFRGGPQAEGGNAFLPLHAEARLTYYIGKDALTKLALRPYVFLAGGLAQVDAKIPNVVVSNDCPILEAGGKQADCSSPSTAKNIDVDAWKRLGQGFAGAGAGAVYAINKKGGVSFEVKAAAYFPSSGFAVSPAIGYVQGF